MRNRISRNTPAVMLIMLGILCSASVVNAEPAKPTAESSQPTAVQSGATMVPAPNQKLECVVQGTPVEFPDDINMKNAGNIVIAKGTKVNWAVPNTTRKGTHTLTADLAPGSSVFLSGVLGGGVPAGVQCTCAVVTRQLSPTPAKTGTLRPVKRYSFNCQVQGTPVEFPDDVSITNTGASAVPKGKILHWSIPDTNRQGDHTLTEDLAAGKAIFLSGAVPGGVAAGVKCGVTVK